MTENKMRHMGDPLLGVEYRSMNTYGLPPELTSEDVAYIKRGGSIRRKVVNGEWAKTRGQGTDYAQLCTKYGKTRADELLAIKERWTR